MLSTRQRSVRSTIAHTLLTNFENLVLLAAGAGRGNTANSTLDGSQFAAGNALTGLTGNDTYIIRAGDTVIEALNAGTDVVRSFVAHTLAVNVENLVMLAAGVRIGMRGRERSGPRPRPAAVQIAPVDHR